MFNTNFLPENYEAPRSAGAYLKLKDGETRIRILSHIIMGWEEWIDKKPIRHPYDQKPELPHDAERPLKHFWSMIVWNYTESRIQLMHITQATIIRELVVLIKDKDWGVPFCYDIKIRKTGKDMLTQYTVTAVPHKAITQEIKAAYEAKPIYLEALFHNADPFQANSIHTEGCFYFGDTATNKSEFISDEQVKNIIELIGDDSEYKKKIINNLKEKSNVNCFEKLPVSMYEALIKSLNLHNENRLKKEMASKDLPF